MINPARQSASLLLHFLYMDFHHNWPTVWVLTLSLAAWQYLVVLVLSWPAKNVILSASANDSQTKHILFVSLSNNCMGFHQEAFQIDKPVSILYLLFVYNNCLTTKPSRSSLSHTDTTKWQPAKASRWLFQKRVF